MNRGVSPATSKGWSPVEPNSDYPFAPGSVEEVVAHLALWGETVPDGLARVEYTSETLRNRATDELQRLLTNQQIPFHTIELPLHTPATQVVDLLRERFRHLPAGVVSLQWSADVFPKEIALEDSLRVLNFRRESLAEFPLRQIWWMDHDFADTVRRTIPDLNSWFFVRLELTEGGVEPQPRVEEPRAGVFMVPLPRNPYFTGREEILQAIYDALHDHKNVLLTQAISGLGGIGKTQTACEYAYRYQQEYRAVLWAQADSATSLDTGYQHIARALGLPEKDAQEIEVVREAVRRRLATETDYLLILDNADDPAVVKPFLPERPGGHVLLTSRARQFSSLGNISVVRLAVMSQEEARAFLLRRIYPQGYTEAEREAAERLVEEVDGLPLALELAAAYIVRQRVSVQNYLEAFVKRRVEMLESVRPIRGDYRETVLTTWQPNLEAVRKQSETAADLLNYSAFLAPDAIPFEIFIEGASAFEGPLGAALTDREESPLSLVELLLPSANYSILQVDMEDRSYAIHRLVQEAIKAGMEEETQRRHIETIVEALTQCYPGQDYQFWLLLDRLLPHQLLCADHITRYDIETLTAGALLNQCALYLQDRAQYAQAATLYERALSIRQKILPPVHPFIAQSLNNLASLYQDQGRYAQAEPLYNEALEIRRSVLLQRHPSIAQSLNNLAGLYHDQGRYEEAETLYNEALAIDRVALGENHPDYASHLNNLALLYKARGRYEQAETLYNEALEISRKALPQGHPDIASSLNNLAGLYKAQGRYEEAETLYNEALAIDRVALGENHPDYATDLNNLALLYKAQGRYEQAETLYNEALEIVRQTLGENHPLTQLIERNYKSFLSEKRQPENTS
jgi:tetratricopeptide (TPR) repeat protein